LDKTCVLAVDDEARYVRAIQINLEARGFEVTAAYSGQQALAQLAQNTFDLVLLDVRMPGMDGYEVCQQIREFSTVPIIMLTAMAEEENKIKGLDIGADDYVTKPFSADELVARVRAALRRVSLADQQETQPIFCDGDLEVNLVQEQVFVAGQEVHLTRTEYGLLRELVRNAGRTLVPDHLLGRVWGPEYFGEVRLLRQAIHRLRKKIDPDGQHPQWIQTRRGIGYIFDAGG
jgi:DNA-binding response OmpR family regulator